MSKKVKSKDEDGSSLIDDDDGIDLGAADEAAGNKASNQLVQRSTSPKDDDNDMKYSTLSKSTKRPSLQPSALKTSKRPSLKQRPSLQRSNSSFNQSIRNLRSTLQHSSSQSFRYVILYFVHMICSVLCI